MTKPIQMLTDIPFSGFYHSIWCDIVDSEESSYAEYTANESDEGEESHPEQLQLSESDIAEILYRVTDYRVAYLSIAQKYAAAFNDWVSAQFGAPLGLKFESMSSPREYNFTTDRIFCHIPQKTVRALFKASKAEKHTRLAAVIAERFTSRDGFISGYPRHLSDWLVKPVRDWDHNEIETLLIAICGEPDDIEDLYYEIYESGYSAWESAVDWTEYESRIAELRSAKLAEWIESDKDAVRAWASCNAESFQALVAVEPANFNTSDIDGIPYRCPNTLDILSGVQA